MDGQRLFTAAALIGLILLAACGGGGSTAQLATADAAATGQGRLDAEFLRSQSGISIDGLGFYRLDRNMHVLRDWQGIEVHGSLAAGFQLDCSAATPDDIFLAISYDDDALQLDSALLTAEASDGNLILAVTRRIEDVTLVGITRTREHGTQRQAMTLADVRFRAGSERIWRDLSLVNEDPKSAVEMAVSSVDANSLTLEWDERNIGDYDNNGLVSISDITPIGLLFQQTLSSHDPPEEVVLVDGDGNGEVNLADLTPIARNFNRGITGFVVNRFEGLTDDPQDFEDVPQLLELRANVYGIASPAEKRQRLHYVASISKPPVQSLSLAVRAFDDDMNLGPFSNVVSLELLPDNLKPVFQDSFWSQNQVNGVLLHLPIAVDPEGEEVSYTLTYRRELDPAVTEFEDIPLSGETSHEYPLTGLVRGSEYSFTLTASDESGLENSIGESTQIPTFDPDLPDRWDNIGADQARTGSLIACKLHEPLFMDIELELEPGDTMRRNEVAFSSNDNLLYAKGEEKWHFIFKDGENSEVQRGIYGSGPFLPSLTQTFNSIYMLATDGQSAWRSRLPDLVYELEVENAGQPLMMGELMFIGRPDGSIHLQNYHGSEIVLSTSTGSPSLSISSDGDVVYQLCEDGTLRRFAQPFFEDVQGASLPLPQAGSSLVHLSSVDALAVALPDGNFTVRSATDLSEVHTSDAADGSSATCLAAVQWTDPPMLLLGESDSGNGRLRAVSMDDWSVLWDEPVQVETISASADRIFIRNSAELQVRDFEGRLRQSIPLAGNVNSQPVLDAQGLAAVHGSTLSFLRESPGDLPPVWQGTEGLRELTVGDGQVTLSWDHAVDEHGEPVHYAVYYGTAFPPDLDSLATSVVTDIPDDGTTTHEYVLDGLDNGTRYWFMVRAYDGWWDDSPNIELNLNWLAATPPWLSEELILGQDLPAGEVFYMRGIADPSGSLHLVYNDEATVKLTHLFGSTGNWQHESDGLAGWPSNAFDLSWDTDLLIGRANNFPPSLSLLTRTGADIYSETVVGGSDPLANPQLAIAVGTEYGMGFTEYISGTLPQVSGHYYYTVTSLGSFLPPIAVEEPLFNYGRDLDLLFDPADNISPWLCFQRGTATTDNRLTPTAGTLQFWRDLGSGLMVEEVDSGVNAPDSDAGKRVRMVLDGSSQPLLAYYDLDSDPLQPRGQFKTAHWDGSQWIVSVLENRDLSFQDQFTYSNTAPELDIVKSSSGEIAIGELLRQNMPASGDQPHSVGVRAWIDSGSGFELEVLTEPIWMLPSDREPCVAMYDASGILHIFVATAQEPLEGEDYKADTILHLWRGE
ncbi:MAG: fibronectin type III domain-containing protein [Planctomycetales bacterium]|nr:fibronectin type III domain-containing protein [bacterium]UNM09984.1 MAG: fibronectin type III domain-containing protein [Planctomycetales bacterium]